MAEMWLADATFVVPYRQGHLRGSDKLWTERLLGTNRLLLHPEEQWQAAPAGRFQFWVAREDAAVEAAPLVTAPHLRVAIGQFAALLEQGAERAMTRLHSRAGKV